MDQTLSTSTDGALRLADWGLIRAQGAEARSFLQGQLTQDVQQLPIGQARLAGYCSPKGRLLASFVVWPVGDEELLLACSADLLPAVLKRLSMYVLRAKCKLSDVSGDYALWGLAGSALAPFGAVAPWQRVAAGSGQLVRLPDALLAQGQVARALLCQPADAPAPEAPPLPPEAWLALEARSGIARISAAVSEQFVPQMINLELVGGVDFKKGCYPGQEIVARSQYRGTLKRRGFAVSGAAPMQPGQEIFSSADPAQPAGMLVLAGSLCAGRFEGLAELKLQAADEGATLHLGGPEGPLLQLGELPYVVPRDAVA